MIVFKIIDVICYITGIVVWLGVQVSQFDAFNALILKYKLGVELFATKTSNVVNVVIVVVMLIVAV